MVPEMPFNSVHCKVHHVLRCEGEPERGKAATHRKNTISRAATLPRLCALLPRSKPSSVVPQPSTSVISSFPFFLSFFFFFVRVCTTQTSLLLIRRHSHVYEAKKKHLFCLSCCLTVTILSRLIQSMVSWPYRKKKKKLLTCLVLICGKEMTQSTTEVKKKRTKKKRSQ